MNHEHIVKHIVHSDLKSDSTLHVIGVISNPIRYHARYRLFKKWYAEMLVTPNVVPYVVEIAFGDRHHEVTDPNNPNHLQLRTSNELWHKENMINLAERRLLPRNWRYLCWSDCDISWPDPNWALETLHQLQHYQVVQPWQSCADLGFYNQAMRLFESFCYVHQLGVPKQCTPDQPYKYAHSGFAWACTRLFWENVGGLMDFPILGSADHHMAWAMVGGVDNSIHGKMGPEFKRRCHEWQRDAMRVTKTHLGFVKTHLNHGFHGPKFRRQYRERWPILYRNNFNPDMDLAYDSQGLLYIVGKPKMQEEVRQYFRQRHEDSIEEQ